MMRHVVTTMIAAVLMAPGAWAQSARNIKLNEVMTHNTSSIQDSYGQHLPWVEIVNTAYSTYNIRGMYIATDKAVLNPKLSPSERMKLMSPIPNGADFTTLSARHHAIIYLGSNPARSPQHITASATPGAPLWIALYNGNAVDILDSLTVPALQPNTSYARQSDGSNLWTVKGADAVTPGAENFIKTQLTKTEKLKAEDPHGIGIAVMCMGIVFLCLALLYVFFTIFGFIAQRQTTIKKVAGKQPIKPIVVTGKKVNDMRHKTANILKDGLDTKGRDKEIYIAVIAMALKQYTDNVHDVESGIVTIKPHHSPWGDHNHFNNE